MNTNPTSTSYFERAFYHAMSYDFLFPSNFEIKKVNQKNSITETIGTDYKIFISKDKIYTKLDQIKKPLRFVARLVVGIAIGFFVAPVGLVANSFNLSKYVVTYLKGDHSPATVQKIKDHASGLVWDFIQSGSFFGTLSFTYIYLNPLKVNALHVIGLELGLYSILFSIFNAAFPLTFLKKFGEPALYKSFALKHEFGIVGTDGKPLKPDNQHDANESIDEKTGILSGHFVNLWKDQCSEALSLIIEYQEMASKADANLSLKPVYPLDAKKISDQLKLAENYILTRIKSKDLSEEEGLKLLNKIFDFETRFNETMTSCFKLRSIIQNMIDKKYVRKWIVPNFYSTEDYVRMAFTHITDQEYENSVPSSNLIKWSDILQSHIKEIDHNLKSENPLVNEFQDRLVKDANDENSTPYSLLGLSKDYTRADLRKAFLSLSKALHPDRNQEPNAAPLFRIATLAYQKLEATA